MGKRIFASLIATSILLSLPAIASAQVRNLVFPVDGESTFRDDYLDTRGGGSRLHHATDIFADKHTRVVAAASGVITYIPMNEPSWGYMITVQDNDGYQYRYIHMNNDTPGTDDGRGGPQNAYASGLKRGSDVRAGQLLGWLGDSGNAEHTRSHLHFEIHDPNGNRINPYQSLLAAASPENLSAEIEFSESHHQHDEIEIDAPELDQFYFSIDLENGMQGEAVRQLQKRLEEDGHFTYHTNTKYFGSITETALKSFQRANGIAPTGVLGFETRALLNGESVINSTIVLQKELFEGDEGEQVLQTQLKLAELGFYTDEQNGVFDWKLREAIRRFQNANSNLRPTGNMNFETWNEMNKQYALTPKTVTTPSGEPEQTTPTQSNGGYTFTLSMSIGSRGNEVVELQDYLRDLGHFPDNIISTGYYGPVTAKAVSSFQGANGIETVGIVGPKTRAALNR